MTFAGTVNVEPLAGCVICTMGGGFVTFPTMTVTGSDQNVFPFVSVALAVMTWLPRD